MAPLLDIAEASQRVRLGPKVASTNMDRSDAPRLAAIVESSDDAIIAEGLNGVILSWNGAAERLFGYTASEVLGKSVTIIFPSDRLEEEARILSQIGRGERVDHYETARRRKDGQIIHVSVTASPIRNASGTVTGVSTTMRDLTGRNIRDQRILELQAELAHVQRLNELGHVVSTLVHEVNQPLTAISNYVNACRRLIKTGDQERIQSVLQRITDQTNRTRGIVERIRDFVKKRDVQMRAETLSQVIEEAITLTRASVRDRGLRLTVATDPPKVQAEIDKVQVQQVLFNLLRNAIVAIHSECHAAPAMGSEGHLEYILPLNSPIRPRCVGRLPHGRSCPTRQHGSVGPRADPSLSRR